MSEHRHNCGQTVGSFEALAPQACRRLARPVHPGLLVELEAPGLEDTAGGKLTQAVRNLKEHRDKFNLPRGR